MEGWLAVHAVRRLGENGAAMLLNNRLLQRPRCIGPHNGQGGDDATKVIAKRHPPAPTISGITAGVI